MLADHIIVPCRAMADRARQYLPISKPITVILDPWQVPLLDYKPFIHRLASNRLVRQCQ